jgi:hypothetical protein
MLVRDLGKKLRRLVNYDVCQRVKHPNRSFTIEEKRNFSTRPDVCPM